MRDLKQNRGFSFCGLLLLCVLCVNLFTETLTVCASESSEPSYEEMVDLFYQNKATQKTLIVDDKADLFSEDEISAFTKSAGGVLEYANVCVATAAEEDYEAYARMLLDSYFGNGSDSTVFLINMDPRRIYIFSEGQTKTVLDQGSALSITDNVYRQASLGAYYACAEKALRQEATLLGGGMIFEPMKYVGNIFLAFLIAILLTYWLTFSLRPKMRKEAIAGIDKAVLGAIAAGIMFSFASEDRIYDPPSSSDSSSGGGGGGGGGDSGAGGGHSF